MQNSRVIVVPSGISNALGVGKCQGSLAPDLYWTNIFPVHWTQEFEAYKQIVLSVVSLLESWRCWVVG